MDILSSLQSRLNQAKQGFTSLVSNTLKSVGTAYNAQPPVTYSPLLGPVGFSTKFAVDNVVKPVVHGVTTALSRTLLASHEDTAKGFAGFGLPNLYPSVGDTYTPKSSVEKAVFGTSPTSTVDKVAKNWEDKYGWSAKVAVPLALAGVTSTDLLAVTGFGGGKKATAESTVKLLDKAFNKNDLTLARKILSDIPESAPFKKTLVETFSPIIEGISKDIGTVAKEIPVGMKERSFIQTAKEAAIVPKEVSKDLVSNYTPVSDISRMDNARSMLETDYQGTLDAFNADRIAPQDIIATGEALIEKSLKEGRFLDATKLIEDTAVKGTNLGQGIQTFALFGRLTPEGMLKYANKVISDVKTKAPLLDKVIGKLAKRPEVKLTPEDTSMISDLMKKANAAGSEEEKAKFVKQTLEYIGKKVPWGVSDVLDTYRYNNMLSNPLTHLRNAINNIEQAFITRPGTLLASGKPLEAAKYEVGALKSIPDGIDAFMKALREGAPLGKLDSEGIKKLKIIRPNPLGAYNTPSNLMEASDQLFKSIISGGEMARGASEKEAKAMAEYSLFRSDLHPQGQGYVLNKIDDVTKAVYQLRNVGLGWFIPFIRTSMNVAKQWIEYSPAGLITLPGSLNKREQLGKAILGSTVTLIGADLAMQDRVTWSVPTDPTAKQLFYDSGRKPYSVKIGDKWVPMSTFGVFAWALGIPAAVKYYNDESRTAMTDDKLTKLTQIPMSLLSFWSNQTFVSGLGSFVDLARGNGGITPEAVVKNIAYTAGQLKPMEGLMRYVATTIDPIYRQAKNVKEQLISDVPFATKSLAPYKDVTGEPSTRNWSNYAAPFAMGQVPAGPKGQNIESRYQSRELQLQFNAVNNKYKNELQTINEKLTDGRMSKEDGLKERARVNEEYQKRIKALSSKRTSLK